MATSSRTYEIFAGTPVTASSSLTLIGTGSAGNPTAFRRLVHPDGVNFPPIVYHVNPDRTTNLDNEVLPAPLVASALTLTSTRVTRFERTIADTIVTEVWTTDNGKASMPTVLARLLYEYLMNPPAFSAVSPEYIIWEPRDRTEKHYNVEIVGFTIGGSDDVDVFDIREVRSQGGLFGGGDFEAALDSIEALQTGIIDKEVRLKLRIVSEV